MKPTIVGIVTATVLLMSSFAISDTTVRGHFRKDGSYVAPHIRSSPNSTRTDNFGPASSAGKSSFGGFTSPALRDSDHDGIPNRFDRDDNNNGRSDDQE